MAQSVPQDEPTKAPKIGPRWVNIAPRWPNIGPRGAQHRPQKAKMGQHRAKLGQHGRKMGQQQQQQRCWWVSALLKGLFLRACYKKEKTSSSTNCHQSIVTPTNCHQPPTHTFSLAKLLTCGVIRSYNVYCNKSFSRCSNNVPGRSILNALWQTAQHTHIQMYCFQLLYMWPVL